MGELKCKKCGSTKLRMKAESIHNKVTCEECGAFVKFLSKKEKLPCEQAKTEEKTLSIYDEVVEDFVERFCFVSCINQREMSRDFPVVLKKLSIIADTLTIVNRGVIQDDSL